MHKTYLFLIVLLQACFLKRQEFCLSRSVAEYSSTLRFLLKVYDTMYTALSILSPTVENLSLTLH